MIPGSRFRELTASNLALNTISGVGMFAGPAIAGVVLAFSGPSLVFALTGGAYAWSGICVLGLRRDSPPQRTSETAIVSELLGGFRAIGADRRLQVIIGLVGAQMFVAGPPVVAAAMGETPDRIAAEFPSAAARRTARPAYSPSRWLFSSARTRGTPASTEMRSRRIVSISRGADKRLSK